MRNTWDRLVDRADALKTTDRSSGHLVEFYASVLRAQRTLSHALARDRSRPFGDLTRDLDAIRPHVPAFVRAVANVAPAPLADEARRILDAGARGSDEALLAFWTNPSDRDFFSKAILQPYLDWLGRCGMPPAGRGLTAADNRCPSCGGMPQVSVLHAAPGSDVGDGGGRSLLCASCLTPWPFRRVLCASCGEEDERKLGYFHAPEIDHVRVDACDTCRQYLKSVDLTRLGTAVPLVDEVASASLDVWARDRGYAKIELNLVGL